MWFEHRLPLAPAEQAALEQQCAAFRSLQDVVRWSFARTPPVNVAEVVVQDEFSHDVVLPFALADRSAVHLVFDTT